MSGCPEPRHIKVSVGKTAPEVIEKVTDELFGFGMVDESGLQTRENLDVPFDRQGVLRVARVERAEGGLRHLAGKVTQSPGTWSRRKDEELAVVKVLPSRLVIEEGVEIYRVHPLSFRFGS